jgi:hypothetical protein
MKTDSLVSRSATRHGTVHEQQPRNDAAIYRGTYFSHALGDSSTKRSMTMSPRDVSSRTLIAFAGTREDRRRVERTDVTRTDTRAWVSDKSPD